MTDPRPGARRCPMFPLGTVLYPGGPLSLQIFEPRYHEMLTEVLAGDRRFGVVLISRGSEVGGGDTRTDVGTLAMLDRHEPVGDGRTAVAARGLSRIEVVEWLADDPYPQALVIDRPDEPDRVGTSQTFEAARAALDELVAIAHAAGRLQGQPDFAWPDLDRPHGLEMATWQLATVAPIAVFDRQRILEADSTEARLVLLRDLLTEAATDLRLLTELESGEG